MEDCCIEKTCAIEQLRERQTTALRIVFFLNAAMFVFEAVGGLLAGSVALVADSLDMFGDALVYGFSLYVVGQTLVWKARAAFAKAAAMGLFGAFVLGQVIYKLVVPEIPAYEAMGMVGALALLVNATCAALLWRHRDEDINMRSVWLCSRNDIVANISVLAASFAVWAFHSFWPDIIVAAIICVLFLRSAFVVGREARDPTRAHQGQFAILADAQKAPRR